MTVDLEKYQIPIPENGYFAGLETIFTKKKYQFKSSMKHPELPKETLICQGPVLSMNYEMSEHLTWLGRLGRNWWRHDFILSDGRKLNWMIRSVYLVD